MKNSPLLINKGFILSSLLLILVLCCFPLYTQDGPNHKKVALTLSKLHSDSLQSSVYQSNLGFFQTNSLFSLLYQPLANHLSIDHFEKIFVGFFLILIGFNYRFFLSVWNSKRLDLWFIILLIWIHPLVFRGFYNFIASFSLSILALTLLKKGLDEKKLSLFLFYTLISWITFLAHPFPLFILLLVIAIFTIESFLLPSSSNIAKKLQIRSNLKWNILYSLPPLFLITLKFFLSLFKAGTEGVDTPIRFMQTIEQIAGLFFKNFVFYSIPHLIIGILAFIGMIILMVYSLKKISWRSKIFWFICLIGFFYSPSEAGGGAYLNDRFLPYLFLFLPLGLCFSDSQLKKIKIIFAIIFFGMISGIAQGMYQIHFIAKDYQQALAKLPSVTKLYPMSFNNNGPAYNYQALHHFWALYDSEKTVFSPYLFAFRELNPLNKKIKNSLTYFPATYDSYPSEVDRNLECQLHDAGEVIDCDQIRKNGFEKILKNAVYYEYWLIASAPKDFIEILKMKPNLSKVSEAGKVSLWRNQEVLPFDPPLTQE